MAGMSKGPGNMSTTTCIGTAVGIGLGVGLGNKIIGGVIAGGGTLICISGLLPDTATSTGQGLCQMQKQQILNNCQASGE